MQITSAARKLIGSSPAFNPALRTVWKLAAPVVGRRNESFPITGRFQVPLPEALQQYMHDERRQKEIEDRCHRVLEAVIQTAMSRQDVEAVILDVPAGMATPP